MRKLMRQHRLQLTSHPPAPEIPEAPAEPVAKPLSSPAPASSATPQSPRIISPTQKTRTQPLPSLATSRQSTSPRSPARRIQPSARLPRPIAQRSKANNPHKSPAPPSAQPQEAATRPHSPASPRQSDIRTAPPPTSTRLAPKAEALHPIQNRQTPKRTPAITASSSNAPTHILCSTRGPALRNIRAAIQAAANTNGTCHSEFNSISASPTTQSVHSSPPSSSSRFVNSAIFFASICLLLIKLITSSSLDPPNILSTRSRTAWLEALASVTTALYSNARPSQPPL